MAMIQGIDGGALLAMLRQGRADGAADRKARADAEREQQISGVMGQLFPSGQAGASGGVAGQYASPNPQASKPTFDQAFGGEVPDKLASGGELPAMETPAPQPMQRPAQTSGQLNMDAFARLSGLDPERAGQVITAIKGANEVRLKQMEAKNTAFGAAAASLAKIPAQQREQFLRETLMPYLVNAGWSEQEIAGRPLTDQALSAYQNQAMMMDQIVDNELANRQFMEGKTLSVAPGGSVALVRPNVDSAGNVTGNSAEYIIGGDNSAPGEGMPSPKSAEDFNALPPGTKFIAPDGSVRQKPGGGGSDAPGGFPGQ